MITVCGGCGLGCRTPVACPVREEWAVRHDGNGSPPEGQRGRIRALVAGANRGLLVLGPGVDGAELLDWLQFARARHWLWLWDEETANEAAFAAEGGRYVHRSWVLNKARTWILWGFNPADYPPWPHEMRPEPPQILTPPAVRGDAALRWLMALRHQPDSHWSEAAVLYDPFALDEALLFLLHRWSNTANGPGLLPLHRWPHRLGARRIVQEWTGTPWAGSLRPLPWTHWEADVVIQVEGVVTRRDRPEPGRASWIYVGPEPQPGAAAWIPYRWTQESGHWSLTDDGVLAPFAAKSRPTVVKTWLW
ncbi:MAG: hypothetical protein OWU84_10380 [Firmicutes bacterium]|nr:hypothetical protein [Bacillota bacterium]